MSILGLRGYFRPDGGAGWIDLGVLKDFDPGEEIEEFNFEGARNGLTEIYDTVVISAELNYTFRSENPLDRNLLGLWMGGTPVDDPATGGLDGFSIVQSFNTSTGDLLFVFPNAQAGKMSVLIFHPLASLKRDGQGGTPGEDARSINFSVTVLADEAYTVPAGVNGATPVARYGYMYVVPSANLDAAETLVSA
jgi:hypothetical protein